MVADAIEEASKQNTNDLGTRIDDELNAENEAREVSRVLINRITNTKKDDYIPGHYPKHFDLSNKVAALHAWHENVLDYVMNKE